MPRLMSFGATVAQIERETKTETRRLGWADVKPGEVLVAVAKCQGLKKGERVRKLKEIRVVSVRREPLHYITRRDVAAEGFSDMGVTEFLVLFCRLNRCKPDAKVTVITFDYQFRCDGCGQTCWKRESDLKGLCRECSKELGGGRHSAQAVRDERRKMERERSRMPIQTPRGGRQRLLPPPYAQRRQPGGAYVSEPGD